MDDGEVGILLVPGWIDMVEDEPEGFALAWFQRISAHGLNVDIGFARADEVEQGGDYLRSRASIEVKGGGDGDAVDDAVAVIRDDAIHISDLASGNIGALTESDVADGELSGIGIGCAVVGDKRTFTAAATKNEQAGNDQQDDDAGNDERGERTFFLLFRLSG